MELYDSTSKWSIIVQVIFAMSLSAARQRKCCRTPRCKQRRGATSDLQRLSCKSCMTVIGIQQLPGKPKRDHPTSVMKNQTSETKSKTMKIVIIGGTGLIGAKLVNNLRQQGHEVVAASPSRGINSVTGEGLAAALAGAQVVVRSEERRVGKECRCGWRTC